MGLWTPQPDDVKVITNSGIVGAAGPGTAVPDGASINTYGTLTEIISAANNVQDSWGISINFVGRTSPSAALGEGCLDILCGGATDDMLIPSMLVGGAYIGTARSFFFPIHIPAGKRIAAQFSSAYAHTTEAAIMVTLYGGSPPPWRTGRKVTSYGTKINNSRGKAVTPTASGGAASVTEMTASTTEDHFYFLPSFQASTDTTLATLYNNIGIGVGAATEERIGTWWFGSHTDERQEGPYPDMGAWRHVPAGSRLTMLASCSGTPDLAYDGIIHAVS